MSKEENKELIELLKENNLSEEDYNDIISVIDISFLEDYLYYRKHYNLKTEDYNRIKKNYSKITNPPIDFDFELFVKHNKDRSYQSNMFLMNSLTQLINSVESTEDLEKNFFESKSTLKDLESTKTLTKFRKVVNEFITSGKIPEEKDSLRQNILSDLLSSYREILNATNQINLLSQESTSATHVAKDLWVNYFMGSLTDKEVWETFKWGVAPKSSAIVYSTFQDLVKKYPKT